MEVMAKMGIDYVKSKKIVQHVILRINNEFERFEMHHNVA